YAMSRELASTRGVDSLLETALRHIGDVFTGQMGMLLPEESGRVVVRRAHPAEFPMDTSELAVAQWVYEHREVAGLGTATLPGAPALSPPLWAPNGAGGVGGMRPLEPRSIEGPEPLHQLETFANQTALAIERAQLADKAQRAEFQAEAERLRNSL